MFDLLEQIKNSSIETILDNNRAQNKEENDQYFTPVETAIYMSGMFKEFKKKELYILDPGCGFGNLSIILIANILTKQNKPKKIYLDLYDSDPTVLEKLKENISALEDICSLVNVELNCNIFLEDFLVSGINIVNSKNKSYDCIILNPPYRKLKNNSAHKKILMENKINVPNYYAAFLAISYRLLSEKGQVVAIIPRSFCSGTYFKDFRNDMIKHTKIERIHIFKSRKSLFYDEVVQETLIISLSKKNQKLNDKIQITESIKTDFSNIKNTYKRFDNVIFPTDKEKIIRIIHTNDKEIVDRMHQLPCDIEELGISVSTGPIVDFREEKRNLSFKYKVGSNPLIYLENFKNGFINHPIPINKPSFIIEDETNKKRLKPSGMYVLVKRFTTQEEKKRIVAGIFDNTSEPSQKVGFDNKLNYFHENCQGIRDKKIVQGLWLYLNSSVVDQYFRTYSGNTQVNVSDLKNFRYPTRKQLKEIGETIKEKDVLSQDEIDEIILRVCY